MSIKATKSIFSIALLTLTTSAFCEVNAFTSRPYAGVDLGYSTVKDSSQSLANTLVSTVGGAATVIQDTSAFAGRFFAGYKITENIDVEIGYLRTNNIGVNFNGVTSGAIAYTGSATLTVSGFDYAALIRPSLNSGYNNVYLRIGGTNLDSKTSVAINGTSLSESTSGMGIQYGIGYENEISPDLKSRIAFTRYDKISGISGNYSNVFSVGIFKNF